MKVKVETANCRMRGLSGSQAGSLRLVALVSQASSVSEPSNLCELSFSSSSVSPQHSVFPWDGGRGGERGGGRPSGWMKISLSLWT